MVHYGIFVSCIGFVNFVIWVCCDKLYSSGKPMTNVASLKPYTYLKGRIRTINIIIPLSFKRNNNKNVSNNNDESYFNSVNTISKATRICIYTRTCHVKIIVAGYKQNVFPRKMGDWHNTPAIYNWSVCFLTVSFYSERCKFIFVYKCCFSDNLLIYSPHRVITYTVIDLLLFYTKRHGHNWIWI